MSALTVSVSDFAGTLGDSLPFWEYYSQFGNYPPNVELNSGASYSSVGLDITNAEIRVNWISVDLFILEHPTIEQAFIEYAYNDINAEMFQSFIEFAYNELQPELRQAFIEVVIGELNNWRIYEA